MSLQLLDKKRKGVILAGAMVGLLLAALDSNIVGTAMPKIIASLNGMELYSWPVTAYLLAMTIAIPLVGKLADSLGFKPVFLGGAFVFTVGSILCGLSRNMLQFILCRGLQGIGGAVLISNTIGLVGLLYPPAERAKYGGIVSSASGVASLLGPFLGGLITDHLNWRWVFFVNIPLGIAAFAIILGSFPSRQNERKAGQADYLGAAALVAALAPMLLAFTWGSGQFGWSSPWVIAMLGFSAVMFVLFGFIERKAGNPIIPLSLFRNHGFNTSAVEMFLLNAVLMGSILFIPLFLQGVKGASASSSGAIITPMLVSLILGVIVTGIVISKTCRYKALAVAGFAVMGACDLALSFFTAGTGSAVIVAVTLVMGIGIGIGMSIFNVAAQNLFPNGQIGTVNSAIQFSGRMGQTIASSALGAIVGASTAGAQLSGASLAVPIRTVFLACAALSAAALIVALVIREVQLVKKAGADEPSNETTATESSAL